MLDNNLAPRIARSLNALFADQHHVVALRDCFPENASDVEWIEDLDQRGGWAVLTRDLHIRTRPHERAALIARVSCSSFLPAVGQILVSKRRRPGSFALFPRWRRRPN